ncbi:MAG: hypothetical protein RM338_22385 [Nostoc sp. DedQUE12a]|nr:hypothetical protein [Nostoc sp. DedQUE12a]
MSAELNTAHDDLDIVSTALMQIVEEKIREQKEVEIIERIQSLETKASNLRREVHELEEKFINLQRELAQLQPNPQTEPSPLAEPEEDNIPFDSGDTPKNSGDIPDGF